MRLLTWIAVILVLIGAFNWFLVGAFEFNVISHLVGYSASRIIYVLIGVGAIILLTDPKKLFK